jgi:hypothetical protein
VKPSTKRNHSEFFILPQNTKYCTSVDIEFGKFYVCALCGVVHVQKDQNRFSPLIFGKNMKLAKLLNRQLLWRKKGREMAKRLAVNEALTKIEHDFLAQKSKTHSSQ